VLDLGLFPVIAPCDDGGKLLSAVAHQQQVDAAQLHAPQSPLAVLPAAARARVRLPHLARSVAAQPHPGSLPRASDT
jgi:hypothetical protein